MGWSYCCPVRRRSSTPGPSASLETFVTAHRVARPLHICPAYQAVGYCEGAIRRELKQFIAKLCIGPHENSGKIQTPHLLVRQQRQVVEQVGHIRVISAKSFLTNREGAPVQRSGFRVLALEFDAKPHK